jgi:multicomponent Na+:H+ antiporter subunit E
MPYVLVVAVLFAFWVILSGYFTGFLLAAGLGSSIAVLLFALRMTVIDREGYPMRLGLAALTYWPWLIVEIIKSAWGVSRIIMHPRLPISPTWVRVKASQRTAIGRVTYANSITLTPGTLTIEAESEEFTVHALTREGAAALAEGAMDRRVTRFEGSP